MVGRRQPFCAASRDGASTRTDRRQADSRWVTRAGVGECRRVSVSGVLEDAVEFRTTPFVQEPKQARTEDGIVGNAIGLGSKGVEYFPSLLRVLCATAGPRRLAVPCFAPAPCAAGASGAGYDALKGTVGGRQRGRAPRGDFVKYPLWPTSTVFGPRHHQPIRPLDCGLQALCPRALPPPPFPRFLRSQAPPEPFLPHLSPVHPDHSLLSLFPTDPSTTRTDDLHGAEFSRLHRRLI